VGRCEFFLRQARGVRQAVSDNTLRGHEHAGIARLLSHNSKTSARRGFSALHFARERRKPRRSTPLGPFSHRQLSKISERIDQLAAQARLGEPTGPEERRNGPERAGIASPGHFCSVTSAGEVELGR
jgi:hypothetical protein